MTLQIDQIRGAAERVAASHGLEIVDLEYQGAGKFRALRLFIEKNAAERARLIADAEQDPEKKLPSGVPAEVLSGVTHEDCEQFSRDFGTLLDVEDLIPGAEYTLEVSSPGLERRLTKAEDYTRFRGSLLKVQGFAAVDGTRHWQGRLTEFDGRMLTLDLTAVKQKGKAKKAAAAASQTVEIDLANVEKANLIAEIS